MLAAAALGAVFAVLLGLTAGSSSAAVPSGFVTRSGSQLELDSEPYRFTGINIYNATNATGCWYQMASGSTLEDSLAAISPSGGPKVIRAWFFQGLATAGGQRDWSGFDHTLSVAASRGVKVVVTLENQWVDCSGADGGPGIYKSKTWYGTGYTQVDPGLILSYRDYVAEIVARYKNDPTILAWQLMNEAEDKDSSGGSCAADAGAVLKSFAEDISGLIKSIDPNHLVSIGTMGSGQCGAGSREEYRSLHGVSTVDLCEFHDYDAPADPMPGDPYNGLQDRITQCNTLAKPLFVGETGIRLDQVGGSIQQRADFFAAKFAAQFAAGVVGILVWNWNKDGPSPAHDIGPGDPVLSLLDAYRDGSSGSPDPRGQVTEFRVGITSGPYGLAAGPDGMLWFTGETGDKIGKLDPVTGFVTEYPSGIRSDGFLSYITAGPDGNMWFADGLDRISKLDPGTGVTTAYAAGITPVSGPAGIAAGPDGNVWFASFQGRVGRIDPDTGVVTEYPLSNCMAIAIAAGPDGKMWFTCPYSDSVRSIDPATGNVTTYSAGITPGSGPWDITAGPDGNLWFTEVYGHRIGRLDPSTGAITEFTDGITGQGVQTPYVIAPGPDGNLWFTEPQAGLIGTIDPDTGLVTEFSNGLTSGSVVGYMITAGPDGNMWFSGYGPNQVGRIGVGPTGPPPPDANGDGILDTLQPVGTPSGSFSNAVQGRTNPTIGTRASGTVMVADVADPTKGVQITAVTDAVVWVCGPPSLPTAQLEIPAGDSVTVTCGSVIVENVTGAPGTSVKVKVSDVTVSFPPGTAGTVDAIGGISVTGVIGTGVTMSVGGTGAPVPAGDSTLIQGGTGNSTIRGTSGNDVIIDLGGNNTIDGKGGNDSVAAGGAGYNTIFGGAGDDAITTGPGNDTIGGGEGNDVINAGDGSNTVNGGNGDDRITTGAGNDTIDGGAGVDTCNAGGGKNKLKNCP